MESYETLWICYKVFKIQPYGGVYLCMCEQMAQVMSKTLFAGGVEEGLQTDWQMDDKYNREPAQTYRKVKEGLECRRQAKD